MSRALVFAGAFNPPTNAHINLAAFALQQTGYDQVIFVPSKMTYICYDQKKNFSFDDETRLTMLKKIAANRTWMVVSDHEIRQKEQPRTYLTLQYLKQQGYTCSLLFGSDKLPELETGWLHVEEICHEFGICCMARYDDNCEEMIDADPYLKQLKPYIHVIHTPSTYRNISSTEVRRLYMEKKYDEIDSLVPEELNGLREYQEVL